MFDITIVPSLALSTLGWIVLGTGIPFVIYNLNRSRKLLVSLPGPAAPSLITGHMRALFGFDVTPFYHRLVSTYGSTVKMNGAFGAEFIWTIDPAAMHSILVKDRSKFERPSSSILFLRLVMGGGLLVQTGDEHRVHRKMPIFMDVAERTSRGIGDDIGSSPGTSKDINIFPWMTAAALELIGEAGLGYSFDSFSGKRNEYSMAIKNIVRTFGKVLPFTPIRQFLHSLGTPSIRRWVVRHIPISNIQQLLVAINIQNNQAEEVLRSRQALLASGGDLTSEAGRGRDIMTLLMKANEAEGSENHISYEDMIGHMNIFMFAGHETTSTAMSRILSVLANNEQIQSKLREEVCRYFDERKDNTNHDGLLDLPYLDAVIRETLRLHGPVIILPRQAQVDTVLPLEYPVDTPSGKISSIPIKKGTRVISSILMADRDPKIWGDRAHEFWPERWIESDSNEVVKPGARLPGVYSPMMTFGGGPTACIGYKFAILEIKVMISALVKTFRFEPSEQEVCWETLGVQIPYLKSEMKNVERMPNLPIHVEKL